MKIVVGLVILAKVAQAGSRIHLTGLDPVSGLRAAYAAQKRMSVKAEKQDVYHEAALDTQVCRASQSVEEVCRSNGRDFASYAKELNGKAQAHTSKVGLGDLSKFRLRVIQAIHQLPTSNASLSQHERMLTATQDEAKEMLAVWDQISHLSGEHVFALKETWTDTDTQLLLALDRSGGFGKSTEDIRQKLPSIKDFERIILSKSGFASVGSGSTLKGGRMGALIDRHGDVVRFNNLVGHALDAKDTGTKTTIHVVNQLVKGEQGLPVFDLETVGLWNSYCNRKWLHGQWRDHDGLLFLLRPSARCGMPEQIGSFSRGFLFYWLVGSEVQHMDLYGFEGNIHYVSPETEDLYASGHFLLEPYLKFEHLLYKQVPGSSSGDHHGDVDDYNLTKKYLREAHTGTSQQLSRLQKLGNHLQRVAVNSEFMREVTTKLV